MRIEIMDTTLRDGEQTSGVSFMPHEKLAIARCLLESVRVDRIEVASARVSDGERRAVSLICRWAEGAGLIDRVEVLGFVDGRESVDWIQSCGGQVMNLLTKGSERHCTLQLRKTPQEHIDDIRRTLDYARRQGVKTNVYLEDWSNGMKDSPGYVFALVDALRGEGVGRFLLPDTLGVLNPLSALDFMRRMVRRYPDLRFDFHAHNDYDLAISNVLAAVLAGCRGIHTAVNGLGERAGNAPLASVQAILKDHFNAETGIDESQLYPLSRMVASYSGISIPSNAPITGESVFTQVAGVHADGDNKSGLYCNALLPERFGRRREYALGKNSGKANILRNLEELGLELRPDEARRVTRRIIELGDRKELVTQEDLPYIVADVLKHDAPDDRVKLVSYVVTTANGLRPCASLRRPVRRLHARAAQDLRTAAGAQTPETDQLRRDHSARRAYRCLRADGHHVGRRRQGVSHARPRRRPDRRRHPSHHPYAQPALICHATGDYNHTSFPCAGVVHGPGVAPDGQLCRPA